MRDVSLKCHLTLHVYEISKASKSLENAHWSGIDLHLLNIFTVSIENGIPPLNELQIHWVFAYQLNSSKSSFNLTLVSHPLTSIIPIPRILNRPLPISPTQKPPLSSRHQAQRNSNPRPKPLQLPM